MTHLTESTPTERAAIVTYWLSSGRQLSTAEVAHSLQISRRTAQRLFVTVSRAIPIYRDDEAGVWLMMHDEGGISPY